MTFGVWGVIIAKRSTGGTQTSPDQEPKSVPCKLNKEETAYANKHQIKGSFKSKDLIQKILLRARKLI